MPKTKLKSKARAGSSAAGGSAAVEKLRRLVKLWRREAHHNLGAEWAYKNQKPISLNRAAFEKGLALAKQQCADQLKEVMSSEPPNGRRELPPPTAPVLCLGRVRAEHIHTRNLFG